MLSVLMHPSKRTTTRVRISIYPSSLRRTSVLMVIVEVIIFSPNHIGMGTQIFNGRILLLTRLTTIDYSTAIWATHRLGGIVSYVIHVRTCFRQSDIVMGLLLRCANPGYTANELSYQIHVIRPSLIITHSSCLGTALAAAQASSLPSERIITFDGSGQMTVDNLIQGGLRSGPNFVERKLQKGEAKTKVAFLSLSSGTTGKPKVRILSSGCCYYAGRN